MVAPSATPSQNAMEMDSMDDLERDALRYRAMRKSACDENAFAGMGPEGYDAETDRLYARELAALSATPAPPRTDPLAPVSAPAPEGD
jgi:hypothetical protein